MVPQIVGRKVRASHWAGSVPKSGPFCNYSAAPREAVLCDNDTNLIQWSKLCTVRVRARAPVYVCERECVCVGI